MSFYTGKNVLVTGAAGLIGTSVVRKLLAQGAHVRAVINSRPLKLTHQNLQVTKADLMDLEHCQLSVCDMDIVINLAAYLISADSQKKYPTSLIRNNLMITSNMMDAACHEEVERFGVVSSSTLYPDVDSPMTETDAINTTPSKSYEGVGNVWKFCEQMNQYYHTVTKTKFAITRTNAVYGPYDNFSLDKRHVIPALIMRAEGREDPFEIWGDGNQVRDFLYSDDMADGLLLTIEKYAVAEAINIATGKGTSIKELVDVVLKISGYEPKITFNTSKPTAILKRILDVSKAKSVLDWESKTSLEEGIKKTIEWYRTDFRL
jgi:GDP-L-fucose synthase